MGGLKITAILLLVLVVNAGAQQRVNKPGYKQVSSIKDIGDSISIDQMVILNNRNLDPFIHDLQVSPLKLFYKKDGIPDFIQSFLESFSRSKFIMANPGKDWNCCDASHDDNLPDRQLICQGNDGHLFLISYLTGGVGEINHLILIKYKGDTITDFWTGTLWKNLTSKDAIVKYLIKNKKKHWGLNTNVIYL